ncbi:sensor histidine kinase [Ferruginibacter sp. SUN106]|uniref:sensor histidine kinase n=1 Tax=Ferruginibacter sp. SUN106 TaxID=2978348 RepID=UPI003D3675CC
MHTQEEEFYHAILIVASVVGIILLYFIITAIGYHRKSIRMHKDKIQAEIDTLENERRRIASDLHDELGPLLSAVKLQINNIETVGAEDQQLVVKSSQHIDSIIQKLREISNNLMPNTLLRKGLKNAIDELAETYKKASKLEIKFTCEQEVRLDQNKEINIYRIVQEVLHNTIKHSGANLLLISLRKDDNRILLATADNGKGFDFFSTAKELKGLGLRNLQSRAEVMGGEMICNSQPGKGVTYIFDIPV